MRILLFSEISRPLLGTAFAPYRCLPIPLGRAVPGTGALPAAALLFTCVPGPLPSVTFPLDLTKTRLQIQGEAAVRRDGAAGGRAVPYRGMLRTAAGIAHEEGLMKLWQGATPAVYRHIGEYLFVMVRLQSHFDRRDSRPKVSLPSLSQSCMAVFWLLEKTNINSRSSLQEGLVQEVQTLRDLRIINVSYVKEVGTD